MNGHGGGEIMCVCGERKNWNGQRRGLEDVRGGL